MEETPQPKAPILEVAWSRYSQYNLAALRRKDSQQKLRWLVALLSVLATLVAILSSLYPESAPAWGATAIKVVLVSLPILSTTLAAFANKFYRGTDWLVLRAGAEQVIKEIYQYRTILQKTDKKRRTWLENRLREIQMQVYTGLNGEMVLPPYTGKLPPPYTNGAPRPDPGFEDLTAERYYELRLHDQLQWHVGRVNRLQAQRIRIQILILLSGAVGAFLAAMGGALGLWVALATALTTAMVSWQEFRNLDMNVRNYSKVIISLSAIHDHWNQLDEDERTKKEFYRMVKETETVLWNQNLEYVKSMQEAFESKKMEEEDFVNQTLQSSGADNDNNGSSLPFAAVPAPASAAPSADGSSG